LALIALREGAGFFMRLSALILLKIGVFSDIINTEKAVTR
jgi:hypothetical protein